MHPNWMTGDQLLRLNVKFLRQSIEHLTARLLTDQFRDAECKARAMCTIYNLQARISEEQHLIDLQNEKAAA